MKKTAGSILLIVLLGGCSPLVFPKAPANHPQKQYHHTETERRAPKILKVTTEDGSTLHLHIGEEVERSFSTGLKQTTPPKTLFQKLWAVLGPWLILFLVLNVLGVFFPVIGGVMGFVNTALGRGTRRIVTGMEKALDKLDDESRRKVESTLSEHFDDNTKKLVRKIKEKSR